MKSSKKIFFFITFLIVSSTLTIENSYAQWIPQNSGTNQNLYDVEFLNEKTGWAVGDAGVIIKTTNGGAEWINVPNPSLTVSGNLWSVFPVDSNIVYVTSGNDLIMKTENGGLNWNILNSSPPGSGTAFKDIFFLNQDTGWFLGTRTVFRTYDGGITLDSFYAPWVGNWAIHFKDINTGILTGDGAVYKSTDGGETWFNTHIPTFGIFHMFRKLAVIGDNVWVIAGSNPPVYKSTNFCETWNRIDTINNYPPSVMMSVAFANELTGWAGGTYGYIYKTIDGGYNWHRQITPVGDQSFRASIYCHNDSVVYVVGGAGRIIYTENGGEEPMIITQIGEEIPAEYNLYQNFPNPFNPTTNIKFQIPNTGFVSLKVFDITGREAAVLVNENLPAGKYNFQFSNDNYQLGSGVYFYTLSYDGKRLTKKFILTK